MDDPQRQRQINSVGATQSLRTEQGTAVTKKTLRKNSCSLVLSSCSFSTADTPGGFRTLAGEEKSIAMNI